MERARSACIIKKLLVLCAALAAVFLGSCSSGAPVSDMELAASEVLPTGQPAEYTVEFYCEGQLLESAKLPEWSKPVCPSLAEPEGLRFLYWADENGEETKPESSPLREDRVYTAVFVPLLDQHVPYLFTNEAGLLRPDAILDNTELTAALRALASDAAEAHFPILEETGGSVSAAMLWQTLSSFYSREQLSMAMVGYAENSLITRTQFAAIMNSLLGRSYEEGITVAAGQLAVPDVRPDRSDFAQLMAASIPHGHGEGAVAWQEVEMSPVYPEGFVLIEGSLYYADGQGYFIYDTIIGSLTFGYDGRYTSGDSALDGYVSGLLRDLAFAHPGAAREELLRIAYEHVRDSFSYLRKNTYAVGAVGWQIPDAISMFECGQGSCYGYAAAFWALARGLGYEAEAFSGAIGKEMLPHAWVEINMDGTNYIFDPDTEAECIRDGGTVRDMFMLHPDIALNWQYYKG